MYTETMEPVNAIMVDKGDVIEKVVYSKKCKYWYKIFIKEILLPIQLCGHVV